MSVVLIAVGGLYFGVIVAFCGPAVSYYLAATIHCNLHGSGVSLVARGG